MHLEALRSKQKEIFKKLRKFSDLYLVGGTALALQLGHRISEDFDLFREKEFDKKFRDKVYRIFKDYKIEVSLRHSEQINLAVDSVKFNFVKYDYPLIFKLKEFQGVKMASVKEIAVMKAFTLGGRGALKDYVDLYFVIKEGVMGLEEIIEAAKKKYQDEFNDRLFAEELTYLKDIDSKKQSVEFLKEPVSIAQIYEFFNQELKKYEFFNQEVKKIEL